MTDEIAPTPSEALAEKELLAFINDTPVVLSLLYDLNLMPEQAKKGSLQRDQMLLIAAHFKEALRAGPPEGTGATCGTCGFRYMAHNGHILQCPLCLIVRIANSGHLFKHDTDLDAACCNIARSIGAASSGGKG